MASPLLPTAELVIPLPAPLASVLRAKASKAHQFHPPDSWRAIDFLAAISHCGRIYFSDGLQLFEAGRPVWSLDEDAAVAELIAERSWPKQGALQALPRASPLGPLGGGQMLWGLVSYPPAGGYVCDLLVLDPETRATRMLKLAGDSPVGGSDATRLLGSSAPQIYTLLGESDAGAAAHIETDLTVSHAWRIDLSAGTYAYTTKVLAPRPLHQLLASSPGISLAPTGRTYFSDAAIDCQLTSRARMYRATSSGWALMYN